MGSRHNRKRTRSRPRNRKTPFSAANSQLTYTSPFALHQTFSPLYFDSQHPPPQQQQNVTLGPLSTHTSKPHPGQSPQERLRQQRLLLTQRHEAAMEAERVRMFGGEEGDPVSLCGPMLRVVMELFGGNVDYVDP